MNPVPRYPSGRTVTRLALLLATVPLPLAGAAQTAPTVQPLNPDADRLADAVRRLGAAPRDLSALIEAGELSFRLGDATAAAALYKRAEQVDPHNGRVKGGIARILVSGERPGEALRYFDLAQRYGAPMAAYAGDRGLAYDLIGQQDRAQRDYRLALRQPLDPDEADEVRRRYALSLGISGQRDEALAQIDALLRKSDRGAWRARAFILAMAGDVAGANKIATSMMPGSVGSGLGGFFQRLPALAPADRAFAVHFGEVAPTPQRLADARLVPVLPALGSDPDAPRIVVATVTPAPATVVQQRRAARSRPRDTARTAAVAAPTPPIAPATAPKPAQTAAAVLVGRPTGNGIVPVPAPVATPAPTAASTALGSAPPRVASAANQPASVIPGVVPGVSAAATAPGPAAPTAPSRVAAVVRPTTQPANVARPVPPRLSEDSILARIISGITVPAAELGVAPMPGTATPPAETTASLDDAARVAERNAAADEEKRQRLLARKAAADKAVAERKAKELADRKARDLAAKKAADAAAAAERKAARAEPARIWVQVAGGASEGDLPRAWKGVQGKTPALAGRRAYTTPLRATNRIVTGPFKTPAEARAMVNTLRKQGLSAFTFTSDAGQKMTRLDAQ